VVGWKETIEQEGVAVAPLEEMRPGDVERVVGVIGRFTRASGFMGVKQKLYTLVVTDRRVIFAELTKERMKRLSQEAEAQAQAEGKGFFGRASAQMHSRDGVAEAYWSMSPDEALRETPTNFAIDRSDIKKVKFKLGSTDVASDVVVIKTAKETYKLQGLLPAHKKQFAEVGLTR
jgi:hypothetical protein